MVRFVLHQLRAARGRAVVLGLGLLVAGAGFSVLSSVSVSSAVAVRGTLNRNFQPAYDILVRPRGTVTALERSQGLVDDGFLSNLYGGISAAQWQRILRLRGVSVAAPVENIGYTLLAVGFTANLKPFVGHAAQQMFRVIPSFVIHDGLAVFPAADHYLYFSDDRWVAGPKGDFAPFLDVAGHRRAVPACLAIVHGSQAAQSAVFVGRADEGMTCAGPHQRVHGRQIPGTLLDRPGVEKIQLGFQVPVLVAAIDPVQEAKLVGLPGAMVSGSYLREGEGLSAPYQLAPATPTIPREMGHSLPMIAASRTFLDQTVRVRVKRLDVPSSGVRLPERLVAHGAGNYLDALPGQTVLDRTYPTTRLYHKLLATAHAASFFDYWTTGGVRYRVLRRRTLAATTLTNPTSVWQPVGAAEFQSSSAPPGANATQFRRLTPYDVSGTVTNLANGAQLLPIPNVKIQGTFDPGRLRGFAPLSKVPLGTFFPPTVTGATPQTQSILHHRPLGPTTNIAGYLGQPPLLLTTLKAAAPFFDSSVYTGNQPRGAPIAAIQVRVAGLHGASRASIAHVKQVAGEIYRTTHLQVDITAGSSPTPVRIDLPAGGFGQPPLTVQQGWVKKGVTTVVLGAANAKCWSS